MNEWRAQWIPVDIAAPAMTHGYWPNRHSGKVLVFCDTGVHIAVMQESSEAEPQWRMASRDADCLESVTHWAAMPPPPEDASRR